MMKKFILFPSNSSLLMTGYYVAKHYDRTDSRPIYMFDFDHRAKVTRIRPSEYYFNPDESELILHRK